MENSILAKRFTAGSILRFAFPNIVMMIFLSLYTIADGMFISRYVGTTALSSTNMCYPIISVELAVGIMLGTGGGALIAKTMGEQKYKEAREKLTLMVAAAIGLGFMIMVVFLIFLEPLLIFLGTSKAQMPYCMSYTKILLYFSIPLFLQSVFQVYFVTAGKPNLGLIVTVIGGVSNMILDYIFMGPMDMGIAGAAVATGIGYSIPAVSGMLYFTFNRTGPLFFTRFHWNTKTFLKSCGNGSSEMITNVAVAITSFLFNIIFMKYWAEDGVAAITIILYFQFVFAAVFMGFSVGVAPVISYKYGAGDKKQLKYIVRICFGYIFLFSVAVYMISMITIQTGLSIFTDPGGAVFKLCMEGFPIFAVSFVLMGISIYASALFTALSNGIASGIISFARTFVFLVGSLLILPEILGETGIWMAVPAAEALGVLVSAGFVIWGKNRYGY